MEKRCRKTNLMKNVWFFWVLALMLMLPACSRERTVSSEETVLEIQETTALSKEIADEEVSDGSKDDISEEDLSEDAFSEDDFIEEESIVAKHFLKIEIGGHVLYAEFADSDAARELQTRLETESITIEVSNYGGWEKVGDLPWSLPSEDEQLTAVEGDIMLYVGHSIVFFYGNNSWAYTRLGTILNEDGISLKEILGGNETEMILSVE